MSDREWEDVYFGNVRYSTLVVLYLSRQEGSNNIVTIRLFVIIILPFNLRYNETPTYASLLSIVKLLFKTDSMSVGTDLICAFEIK